MSAPDFEDEGDEDSEMHLVPLNDKREHDASCDCWCGPYQTDDEDLIFIHNSEDDLANDRVLH